MVAEDRSFERSIERLAITKESILGELAKIAFANMQDYMKVGEDGQPSLNFKDLNRAQAAALAEITVEEFKDGRSDKREVRRVKFKLANKLDALELLGKHLGLFIERHEIGGPGDFARMTDDELHQALVGQAEALGLPEDAIAGLLTYRKAETEPESTEES
jgi:phage terminase small subunit